MKIRMSRSRTIVQEFLQLYKSLPCLWKVQCKEYSDRHMKTEAYKLMAQKLGELEPDANRVSVIKKINNLRSNYRKERRKVQAALADGSQYSPSLWYYHLLGFLDGQEDSDSESIDIEPVKLQFADSPLQNDDEFSQLTETTFELAIPNGSTLSTEVSSGRNEVNLRKRKHDDIVSAVDHNRFQIVKCEDRHDAFGRSIAFKLRSLRDDQRIFAEKLINEAIFEAELESLNRHCRVEMGQH